MRILVTGGCGFIGSNFVRYLRKNRPEDDVVVLDALTYAGNLANLDGVDGVRVVRGDVRGGWFFDTRVFALKDCKKFDAVVHFAAESHVDRSIALAQEFIQTNVLGTANLLDWARAARVSRFIQVSTDEVYGHLGPNDPAFTEETPIAARSPYAASKAAADCLALAWHRTHGLPVIVTRSSNNYGPRQFPEKLIPLAVTNAIQDKTVPVYGDGMNVRDWLHVEDHCEALDLVLRRGREGDVYNIGGRSERPNLEVVMQILTMLGKSRSKFGFVLDRKGHDRRYAVDSSKIERELGWRRRHESFEDGLAETVRWYVDNEAWWRGILSGEYRRRNEELRNGGVS